MPFWNAPLVFPTFERPVVDLLRYTPPMYHGLLQLVEWFHLWPPINLFVAMQLVADGPGSDDVVGAAAAVRRGDQRTFVVKIRAGLLPRQGPPRIAWD